MNDPSLVARGKAVSERLARFDAGGFPLLETDWPADIPLPPEPPPDDVRVGMPRSALEPDDDAVIDGARFILDQPAGIPALWGRDAQVLWAEGEALMIAGPQGVGKTTLAGQLVRALLVGGDVLGLPVERSGGRILYLAMDRPRQISRSLSRQFTEADRDVLAERLVIRPGPPPASMAAQPTLLAGMAEHYSAAVVFVDSLKDAAIGLAEDEVGAGYNRARQLVLAAGVQLAELHHVVKRSTGNDRPSSPVDAIYGSTWLTSGAGSIVLLSGEPGDPIVGFRHVKQPGDEVGPWRLLHDATAGVLSVEHSVDLVALVKAGGPDGLTAKGAAQAITEKPNPTRADVEKARRRLERLAADGVLVPVSGDDRRQTTAWFLAAAATSRHVTVDNETAGQARHGLFGDHES